MGRLHHSTMLRVRIAPRGALAFVIVLFFAASPAMATWSTHGPWGGGFWSVAIDPVNPDVMYVGAGGQTSGVYKTTDGGMHWVALDHRWHNWGGQTFVAIDPSDRNTIYAVGQGTQISHDGGASWSLVSSPDGVWWPSGMYLVIDPTNPSRMYTDGWRSEDHGATWSKWSAHPADMLSLAINPADPSTMYATQGMFGVFKSVDRGGTWQQLPGPAALKLQVVVDPHLPSTVYLATTLGLYRSDDAGATWSPGLDGLRISSVAVSTDGTVLASSSRWGEVAVYRSTDKGHTWARVRSSDDCHNNDKVAFSPTNPAIAVVFGDAVSVSRDGGATWSDERRDGLNAVPLTGFEKGPDGSWYAVGQRIYRSADQGESWETYSGSFAVGCTVSGIAFDPTNSQRVYVSSWSRGLVRSNDAGRTWTSVFDKVVTGLSIDPSGSVYIAGPEGLMSSSNGGVSWTSIDSGDWWGINANSPDGDLFAWMWSPARLYRFARSGAPKELLFEGQTWSVRFGPGGSGLIVTGGDWDGNRISTDNGRTWRRLWGAFDADVAGSQIYLPYGGSIRMSRDFGSTWSVTDPIPSRWLIPSRDEPSSESTVAIFADPDAHRLLFGARSGGVYVWSPNIPRRAIRH